MIKLSEIPEKFSRLKQWVLWKYVVRDGTEAKLPYTVSGKMASVSNPDDWSSLDDIKAADPRGYAGIGFVFTKDDPYVGIDLDDCVDDSGEIADWAIEILNDFSDDYAEFSPSGTGVKIWTRGSLPINESGKKKQYKTGSVEMYQFGRYFTFTGRKVSPSCLKTK